MTGNKNNKYVGRRKKHLGGMDMLNKIGLLAIGIVAGAALIDEKYLLVILAIVGGLLVTSDYVYGGSEE